MRASALVLALVATLPACGGGHDTHSDVASGRVITMSVNDALRFDPATVPAKPGEKVRFRIANAGKVAHEFVLGDVAFQTMHREQMTNGATPEHGEGHADGGTAVALPPGKTVDVDVTLPDEAPTFACYVDRHADAGMVGAIEYRA